MQQAARPVAAEGMNELPAAGGINELPAAEGMNELVVVDGVPDNSVSTNSYTFLTRQSTSPAGAVNDVTYDVNGRITTTVAHNGANPVSTSYQYAPFGQLWVAIAVGMAAFRRRDLTAA